jgi:HAE1 family hydrophobic/amphiphilic exporter-1
MNISETCIRRPVLTTLLTASLIVFGVFAYRLLPVAALPAVDFPTIQITAQFPGASPETMASRSASRRSPFSSILAAISTAPRSMCRQRSPLPRACCRSK